MILIHKGREAVGHAASADRPRPEPQPAAARGSSGWRLGRVLRFLIGAGLLALPAWLLLPGLWTVSSAQAVVNAHVITLTSPIEGIVTVPPPALGRLVAQGTELLQIDSHPAEEGRIDELETELASLQGRVDALKQHHARTEALKSELLTAFSNYKESMIRRVEHELQEARSEAGAAGTVQRQRVSEENEEQVRSRRGLGSLRELSQARFAAEIAANNAARAATAVIRLSDQLESIKRGVFTGPGDSRNDVPYSQQRIHELAVQQLDDEAKIQEDQAHVDKLRAQIETATKRSQSRSSYRLKAPVEGIVWRNYVVQDSAVGEQSKLIQLIIASSVFVDAIVDERYADDVRPGDKVLIRLIGTDVETAGTLKHVLGSDILGEDETLATEPPRAGRHEVHVIIEFARSFSAANDFNQGFVGRRAEVRFPGITRSVFRTR